MVDLNELEKRLDMALANETEESLSEWILDRRNKNLSEFLGKGSFEKNTERSHVFRQSTDSSRQSQTNYLSKTNVDNQSTNNNYDQAA